MSTFARAGYHHGDLRTALFEAALALLAESGVDALSLRAVTRRAGVSAMAPYRHYADKAALLAEVAIEGFHRLRDTMRDADRTAARDDALPAQARAYIEFALANAALFKLMFDARRFQDKPGVAAAGNEAFGILSERLAREASESADPSARAVAIWALAHGLADLYLEGQIDDRIEGSRETVIRRVVASAFEGLA